MLVAYDLQAKQPAKAIARVQAQIAKSPQNARFYVQLAALQMATKDLQDALASSQKAMQLSPGSPDAVKAYTQVEVAMGNTDAAISAWQTWIAAHPNDPQAPLVLGTLEETKGDSSKAEDLYKKALQLDPNDAVAANNLAYLMVESNQNVDVALTLAQTAQRIFQNNPATQNNPMAADTLAWVYYYKGNYGAARDLLEGAVKTLPNDPQMQYHLGMIYIKLNDKADAQLHLKKAETLAPNSKPGKDASAQLGKLG
jgi:tetratricopeptide (TPR) repeat protein